MLTNRLTRALCPRCKGNIKEVTRGEFQCIQCGRNWYPQIKQTVIISERDNFPEEEVDDQIVCVKCKQKKEEGEYEEIRGMPGYYMCFPILGCPARK